MKKIIFTLIASICSLSLTSCGNQKTKQQQVQDDIKKSQEYHKQQDKERRAEEQRLSREIIGR